MKNEKIQHIFIVGAKSIGQYGGYETFIDKLTECHQKQKSIKYHIACKYNGEGYMDETKLNNVTNIVKNEQRDVIGFTYHNSDVFKIKVPKIGPAVAIYYDLASLNYCINYCVDNEIQHPIIYILACRVGPFIKKYVKQIHDLGGKLYINPDGHEWMRTKWSKQIRRYWKLSEKRMVKYADLIICDSINIEKYIKNEYAQYNPNTTYISYGSDVNQSILKDDDAQFCDWLKENNININEYYLVVGRFVPENNYLTMIKEFMNSNTNKSLVLITNNNDKFYNKLDDKLSFKSDKRIKFVGPVYEKELLKKIRENAFAYFHGHEVGGTNPSLLEALGSTKLNLLLDVGFNREVAQDSALYWDKTDDSLKKLIEKVETFDYDTINELGLRAKKRITDKYSWEMIGKEYKKVFLKS